MKFIKPAYTKASYKIININLDKSCGSFKDAKKCQASLEMLRQNNPNHEFKAIRTVNLVYSDVMQW